MDERPDEQTPDPAPGGDGDQPTVKSDTVDEQTVGAEATDQDTVDEQTVEAEAADESDAEAPPGADALPGMHPGELRRQAQRLHEEAGDHVRAAGELRDAAAALRKEAAELLERVPGPGGQVTAVHDGSPGGDPDSGDESTKDPGDRRGLFRRRRGGR